MVFKKDVLRPPNIQVLMKHAPEIGSGPLMIVPSKTR
jgi:hypothetical protein